MSRQVAAVTLAFLLYACSADSGASAATARPTPQPSTTTVGSEPTDPTDVTYVEWDRAVFTVIDSPEADALFESTVTCTNDVGGYTASYPASWHTNEAGEAPACSWFGPEPFAHAPATLARLTRPAGTPISLSVMRTGLGQILEWPRLLTEEVVIGGVDGHRTEDLVPGEPPEFNYGYSAWLDPDPMGLKFIADTGSAAGEDGLRAYVLNKAVLDRMMALIQFEPAP